MRLYNQINSPRDASNLNRNLSSVVNWSNSNLTKINHDKTELLRINIAKRNLVDFEYKINDVTISSKETVRGLGVKYCNKFTFVDHLKCVTCHTFKIL